MNKKEMLVKWGNHGFMNISRQNDLFIVNVDKQKMAEAIQAGMPITVVSEIKTISKELPPFIASRIPSKELRDQVISKAGRTISKSEADNLLTYIDITHCKQETDKLSIDVVREKEEPSLDF